MRRLIDIMNNLKDTVQTIKNIIQTLALILDDNSEIGAHVRSNLCYLIRLM